MAGTGSTSADLTATLAGLVEAPAAVALVPSGSGVGAGQSFGSAVHAVKTALEHERQLRNAARAVSVDSTVLVEILSEQMLRLSLNDTDAEELSQEELQALHFAGVDLADQSTEGLKASFRTGVMYAAQIVSAYDTGQVSTLLGISPSQVRRRLRDRQLYGFRYSGQWRLPRWQFVDNGVAPGLADLVRALPVSLHPISVRGFVERPNIDLMVDEVPLSPIAWLTSGGPVAPVTELAAGLPSAA